MNQQLFFVSIITQLSHVPLDSAPSLLRLGCRRRALMNQLPTCETRQGAKKYSLHSVTPTWFIVRPVSRQNMAFFSSDG